MPQPQTALVPEPGYSPIIGSMVAMLGYTRATTLAAVDGLTVVDLEHRHDAGANSIGALLAHIAAAEWYYLTTTLEQHTPEESDWSDWGAALRLGPAAEAAARGHDVAWHTVRLGALRERTLAGLRARNDGWLSEQFELGWRNMKATNLWAWYHVSEDELNHRGQIRWLVSRLPSRAAGNAAAE